MKGQGKPEIPKKTHQPASSSTIHTCKNLVTQLGIEPDSPCMHDIAVKLLTEGKIGEPQLSRRYSHRNMKKDAAMKEQKTAKPPIDKTAWQGESVAYHHHTRMSYNSKKYSGYSQVAKGEFDLQVQFCEAVAQRKRAPVNRKKSIKNTGATESFSHYIPRQLKHPKPYPIKTNGKLVSMTEGNVKVRHQGHAMPKNRIKPKRKKKWEWHKDFDNPSKSG
ncbi:hypothetical protein PR048_013031 [Dryococelus australis]|uniref:Uncharacterized protein n=1 Tax=Dryococelus australis TaxID=614101 RepID=A0ABQ9HR18_9NEOP|nr:hypothetical protein PR048_013031 [Dryococelus australis]